MIGFLGLSGGPGRQEGERRGKWVGVSLHGLTSQQPVHTRVLADHLDPSPGPK